MSDFRGQVRRVRMKDGADVTVLRPMVALDIVQQLRRTADEIERGDISCSTMVAVMNTDDGIEIYGWGEIDGARAAALLSLGTHKFHQMVIDCAAQEGGRAI